MHSLRRWTALISIVTMMVLVGLAGFTSLSKAQGGGTTTRVSVASDGTQGNTYSWTTAISNNERYVAFYSFANNLVAGDTNAAGDVFVHDRQTGTTTRVSVASDGTQGNNFSYSPAISADGQYIAFHSNANNLVANDTNNVADVFVHDHQTGITTRVSVASDGTQGNGESSFAPAISADGRYVAFASPANNLVPGDTNGVDVFVHDRQTGTTTRVSVASDGTQGNEVSYDPAISADGRYVVFRSDANNLVLGDTNNAIDVFVHDRQTGVTTRVSVASDGTQGNYSSKLPDISAGGRYVAFESTANNLVAGDTNNMIDVFVHDFETGITTLESVASDGTQGNQDSYEPAISADGRYVAFRSFGNNFVADDTNAENDVFVHDRQTGTTTRVSIAGDGTQGNSGSGNPAISGNGRSVAFFSYANNLVAGDTNEQPDVFVREEGKGPPLSPTPTATIDLTPSSTPTVTSTPSYTPIITNTPPPGATFTPTSTWTPTPTSSNTPPPGATLTPTSTWTSTPPSSNTPPPGATFTPTSTWTPSPTSSNTPPPGATLTPTYTPTQPVPDGEVFIPLVLRQYGFATPSPATPTPTATITPLPTCEVLDHEPNNYFLEANANLPLCEGGTVTGNVAANDIDDIYRIEVSTSGIARMELTNLPTGADYDLYLYNADRGEVTVANTPGSVNETIRINIPNGRYYIRVYSRTYAGSNTYQLRWARE